MTLSYCIVCVGSGPAFEECGTPVMSMAEENSTSLFAIVLGGTLTVETYDSPFNSKEWCNSFGIKSLGGE